MAWAQSEKVTFEGAMGEMLAARLDRPPRPPIAYALFAHCFTCSKDIFAAKRIAAGLVENGIAVLRFDFTGLGHSDGEFANTNFSSNVGDLVAAADWLAAAHEAPAILIGHSLGGAAVLAAAERIPDARAVCTVGAPADPAHVRENFHADLGRIESEGLAEVSLAGRPFTITKQFLDDIAGQSLDEAIGKLRKALLVFHGPLDATVGIENAGRIFQAARHPKSFISLDRADHLLSGRDDAVYVANIIGAWARRHIAEDALAENREMSGEGEVVVAESGEGRFGQYVSIGGRHVLRADEPPSIGGDDAGPAPYDLLLAGLGACTSMTLRMYADRKGWPLEAVSVSLRHGKIHAKDCADCETTEGRLDLIERDLTISGELAEDQRAKLLEIADKCPVHRTLHGPVKVRTVLAD
ncbi:MAG: bifunctional alpha/beta hydrolase/OsmC family protein [Alphaproteobacteria bacterium]|nr:bifunctional alpha/beta hydrolase/OsmC family protein [Alphaproteobacteria bacterium]MDP6567148.1 bifunctional alpha/beta hydrolase/OsmC family protein [Alphaproteobacteria bacterium]MDP6816056.1 bifunctional alpha/beta hydrolase/OsmC family protein [Alphaproteobacteria bacterium]